MAAAVLADAEGSSEGSASIHAQNEAKSLDDTQARSELQSMGTGRAWNEREYLCPNGSGCLWCKLRLLALYAALPLPNG